MNKKITPFMFYIAFVASLGGFLFGFDTIVISGADKGIQAQYALSDFLHGFTMATALFGTIVGALFCGKPAEKLGRIESLKIIAYLYFISALGCALVVNWYALIIFRFMGGLAVGASSVVGPMYIAEISPSQWRGRFVGFFQFNIVLGALCSYISNWYISSLNLGANDWRIMLGILALPALLFAVLLFTVPESPRWLVKYGKETLAYNVLDKVGGANIAETFATIKSSLCETSISERLFQSKYFKPLLIAFFISTFNQWSGINAINYYAPRILETAGIGRGSAMFQSMFIGVANLIFTIVGMVLIDCVGRKKLLYVGSVFMTIALCGVSCGFFNSQAVSGYYMLGFLMLYIGAFGASMGAVIWVLIAEVFPNSVRSKGQVFGSMVHWVWCAIITWIFPIVVESGFATYTFGVFALMSALTFVFALKLPDTSEKSLEEIQKELVGK